MTNLVVVYSTYLHTYVCMYANGQVPNVVTYVINIVSPYACPRYHDCQGDAPTSVLYVIQKPHRMQDLLYVFLVNCRALELACCRRLLWRTSCVTVA